MITLGVFALSFLTVVIAAIYDNKKWSPYVGVPAGILAIVSIMVGACASSKRIEKKPREFPATEYTLEYKVTEYQGRTDTTYVLIKK